MKTSQWPPRELIEYRNALELLAACVQNRHKNRTDDEQMWLNRFFVVRICGYLEQVVHETLRGYITAKSGGPVRTFAHSWLERSKNPSPDNMLNLVGRLDRDLGERLRELLDDNDKHLCRELGLLLDRRHKIAHGLNEGMTESKALSLMKETYRVADWFIEHLSPFPRVH